MGKAEQLFEDQRDATLVSPHNEASKMLEAALQQMDGIISGSRFGSPDGGSPRGPALHSVTDASEQLLIALRQAFPLPPPPDQEDASLILHWLNQQIHPPICSCQTHAIFNESRPTAFVRTQSVNREFENGEKCAKDKSPEIDHLPPVPPPRPPKPPRYGNVPKEDAQDLEKRIPARRQSYAGVETYQRQQVAGSPRIGVWDTNTTDQGPTTDFSSNFMNHVTAQGSPKPTNDISTSSEEDSSSSCSSNSSTSDSDEDEGQVDSRTVTPADEGGDDSSPEDESSTLKCAAAWSGSESARKSSTSDISSSSEDEKKEHLVPNEDLTTGCEEDFQWIRNSSSMDKRRHPCAEGDTTSMLPRALPCSSPRQKRSEHSNDVVIDIYEPQVMASPVQCSSTEPSQERDNSVIKSPDCVADSDNSKNCKSCDSYDGIGCHTVPLRKPPRGELKLPPPPPSSDKTSSLDRRRHRSSSRASRDQKSRSTILMHSPRFHSPSGLIHCGTSSSYSGRSSPIQQHHCEECYVRSLEHSHCHHNLQEAISTAFDSREHNNQCCQHDHYGSCGRLDAHKQIHSCHRIGSHQDLYLNDSMTNHCCSCRSSPAPVSHCYKYSSDHSLSRWKHFCKPPGDVEERLRKLECDKDSLQLQVTVLNEQIDAQSDKITDLEKMLEEKKRQLSTTEEHLQREMLSRSSLETQKLELLSAISELKLQYASLERDNLELREKLGEEQRRRNKPPSGPRIALLASSTPVGNHASSHLLGASPSPSPVSSHSEGSPRRLGNYPNSVEDFKEISHPRTPPSNYRRKVEHYGSLPRQRPSNGSIGSAVQSDGSSTAVNSAPRKGVAFGKGIYSFLPLHLQQQQRIIGTDKSYSTPNLAETERIVIEDRHDEEDSSSQFADRSASPDINTSLQIQKTKGIKKILGRIKRSSSGNLDDLPGEGEFKRGGVRSTAGPRLGWSVHNAVKPLPDLPFADWDSDAISRWLHDLGLECYAAEAKRWVKSGAQLLAASTHEIDKELGIKNSLHRKKLQLALLAQQENITSQDPHLGPAGQLDTSWVLRWLDDVGLPQHKETFFAARIDGRVLHRLTVDDLATLHVTSLLHVASLRRGIQVLRDHGFDGNCLRRRSLPDDPPQPTASDVALWTIHRVMEWLRIVDLAEYAPNLRGSGVHGGLMVHEPRFTSELLASLLSIPPSKTLLRRHLNTHFKELLGRDCIQLKRDAEGTLGYVPLSATTKIKVAKKSQFTLKRKKSKSELDFGDLVCPLDPNKTGEASHGDGTTSNATPKQGAAYQEIETNGLNGSLSSSPSSSRVSNV